MPASLAEVETDGYEHGRIARPHSQRSGWMSTRRGVTVHRVVEQNIQKVASETPSVAWSEQTISHAHPMSAIHIPESSLQIGDVVEIHGLLGSVELNGRRGWIVSFVITTSRFEVRLTGLKDTIGVKSTNLHRFDPPSFGDRVSGIKRTRG